MSPTSPQMFVPGYSTAPRRLVEICRLASAQPSARGPCDGHRPNPGFPHCARAGDETHAMAAATDSAMPRVFAFSMFAATG
jgi:hypothetical protein